MGNREDLIAGAKRCLRERGYARTTARDITAAAGTSLASIGYHFGSTETLLNTAMFELADEWSEEIGSALAGDVDPQARPLERFEAYWSRVIESFTASRGMWASWLEIAGQLDRIPQLRQAIADGIQESRGVLASMARCADAGFDAERAHAVGSLHHALLTGVMVQWLVDPDRAPSARQLTDALLTVAGVDPVSAREAEAGTGR
ncbi:TetR/AcrR family transcriptional regulator [Pseudonocardia sp. DLS-67]